MDSAEALWRAQTGNGACDECIGALKQSGKGVAFLQQQAIRRFLEQGTVASRANNDSFGGMRQERAQIP